MKIQKITSQKPKRTLTLEFALGVLLFLNGFSGAYYFSVNAPTIDIFTWWAVPYGLSHGYIENPYDKEELVILADEIKIEIETTGKPNVEKISFRDILRLYKGSLVATASPFFYSVFSRIVSDDYQLAKSKFIFLSVVCFTVSVLILGRLLNYSYFIIFIFYAFLTSWFSPYLSEIKVGNVNQIQLFLVSLFILSFAKAKNFYHFLGVGVLLGFSILFKPNLFFILFFALLSTIFNKDFKKTLALVSGLVLSSIVVLLDTASYFKTSAFSIWKIWIQTCPSTLSGFFSIETGNYSLSKLISVYSGLDVSKFIYAALLGTFIWILFVFNRFYAKYKNQPMIQEERPVKEAFMIASVGLLTMLLGSRLVWVHYLLLTVPMFLFFLRPQTETGVQSSKQSLIRPLTYVALILSSKMITWQMTSNKAASFFCNIVVLILVVNLVLEVKSLYQEKSR